EENLSTRQRQVLPAVAIAAPYSCHDGLRDLLYFGPALAPGLISNNRSVTRPRPECREARPVARTSLPSHPLPRCRTRRELPSRDKARAERATSCRLFPRRSPSLRTPRHFPHWSRRGASAVLLPCTCRRTPIVSLRMRTPGGTCPRHEHPFRRKAGT